MSKMRSVYDALVEPTKTAERLPFPSRATVTLGARLSSCGRFNVGDVGLPAAVGPRHTWAAVGCRGTVRLPVTAIAASGTGTQPVTQNVRGTWLWNRPAVPNWRVSRARIGSIAT